MAVAGGAGKAAGRGEPAAAQPHAGPFNPAESDSLGGSVVADTLVVLED